MSEQFVAWRRPAITDLAKPDTFQHGRLVGSMQVTLTDDGGAVPASADFLFAGPGDVRGLAPGVVIARKPAPGTLDAEVTRVAHVELGDAALPWRYTPAANAPTGLPPWLVLVVGLTDQEVFVLAGAVRILNPALRAHPLGASAAWAHVHELTGGPIARILSPRSLEPGRRYTAALVPAYKADGAAAPQPAWTDLTPEVTLRCYDTWQFTTIDENDDFAMIAGRLSPLGGPEQERLDASGFGRAALAARTGGPILHLHGALGVVTGPDDPPLETLPPEIATAVNDLAALSEQPGRWVLGLPRYDEPWAAPDAEVPPAGWRRQLREDPRHRGAAGLGAWASLAWQDRIGAGAARQAGALELLAERVRHLSLGLRSVRSQWTRRLPTVPLDALAVVGPMLAGIPSSSTSTVLDSLSGRTSRLVPALFSSAARRMVRPRTALHRLAAPGATRLPELIRAAATRCPPEPPPLPGQKDLLDIVADPGRREEAARILAEQGGLFAEQAVGRMPADAREDIAGVRELFDAQAANLLGQLVRPQRSDDCRPLGDLDLTARSILDGIDPRVARPVVVGRVLDGFTGVRQPELAAPDLALELDIPLWSFLRDAAPDWLLPGGGDVPNDRVLALQTNPDFVDGFLLGANWRALRELRWRNLPLVTGWTPLRRFWQRIADDAGGPATDIRPVLDILTPPSPGRPIWTDDSCLGAVDHSTAGAGPRLVILLHTELFRRYPATLVYLLHNPDAPGSWTEQVEQIATAPIWPNLSGRLHPELVFFGFPLPPEAAQDHWLVLEEPPPGYRFNAPTDAQRALVDAATYARATLNHPVRAFFGNLL